MGRVAVGSALVAVVLLGLLGVQGCTSTIPNRDPVGEPFPAVRATPLTEGPAVEIPGDYAGRPVVLLVGYVQDAQFDLDRWLLGALDAELGVDLLEVPAARGMGARLASGFIDRGMRSGIPPEDWAAVATTYGAAAEAIAEFTGTEGPRNARVLLLDPDGVVRWFHDRGYSARRMLALREAAAALR